MQYDYLESKFHEFQNKSNQVLANLNDYRIEFKFHAPYPPTTACTNNGIYAVEMAGLHTMTSVWVIQKLKNRKSSIYFCKFLSLCLLLSISLVIN